MPYSSCEAGGFVHIPIGARHAFMNVSDQPGECIVTFSPGATDKFFEEFAPVVARWSSGPRGDRSHLCQARMGSWSVLRCRPTSGAARWRYVGALRRHERRQAGADDVSPYP
jgi:hypothetical protein